jgi:hypothetical protein
MIVRHIVSFDPSLEGRREKQQPTNPFIFFSQEIRVLDFFHPIYESVRGSHGREMIALIALIICQSGLRLLTYNLGASRTQLCGIRWGTISHSVHPIA